jgi:hypothetical protein
MSESLRSILAGIAALMAFVPLLAAAQRPPDLSGDWALVSATSSGAGGRGAAGETDTRGDHRVTSNTVSGAAFNCGRGCTIVHKGQTLRIDGAYLGSNDKPAPPVTLLLDGRQRSVVDSFNPGREIPATGQWVGDRLKITSPSSRMTTTQLVSLEASQLIVVTSVNMEGAEPVTLRYKRKQGALPGDRR